MNRGLHAVGLQSQTLACLREVTQSSHWGTTLHIHGDSVQAMQRLGSPQAFGAEVAALLVLDMRQVEDEPRPFLQRIRSNSYTRWMPVVVLCPGGGEREILQLSLPGVNAVVAPDSYPLGEHALIECLCRFWLEINQVAAQSVGSDKVVAAGLADQRFVYT